MPRATARLLLPAIVLMAGLGLLAVILLVTQRLGNAPAAALIGGPFALTAQDGKPRTDADFRGGPMLVFFGYTHCPDVCPTTLFDLSQAFARLGPKAKIAGVFITVDPERDTPAVLKDYLASFDARITGLSGSRAALEPVYKAYRAYAKKSPGANGEYTMDHVALVYLMDSQGRFVGSFNTSQPPEAAAKELAAFL